jgi:hypothetical protein
MQLNQIYYYHSLKSGNSHGRFRFKVMYWWVICKIEIKKWRRDINLLNFFVPPAFVPQFSRLKACKLPTWHCWLHIEEKIFPFVPRGQIFSHKFVFGGSFGMSLEGSVMRLRSLLISNCLSLLVWVRREFVMSFIPYFTTSSHLIWRQLKICRKKLPPN